MHSPSFRVGVFFAITLIVCSCLALAASSKQAVSTGKTGDLWEVTSQLSMEGMPMKMPSQKNKVCAQKNWKEPPGAQNPQQECQISDMQTVGSKTTWKMRCTSPDATGEGEVNRTSPTAYTGNIKMTSADGTINIKLSGLKVGECDYAETEAMPAQAEAMSQKLDADLAKMQAEGCKGIAEGLMLDLLKSEGAGCNDAATKEIYCKKAVSSEGLKSLIERGNTMPGNGLQDALAFCNDAASKGAFCSQYQSFSGYDMFVGAGSGPGSPLSLAESLCNQKADEVKSKLCKAGTSGMENLVFVAKNCPDQAKPIAEKECAGRNFTGAATSPYAPFCMAYAAQVAQEQPAADAPADEPKSKKDKTKKFFKSVWPN